ncbi:uncharacterized protein A4U43_C07F19530 [Asparagus officinalis]|uniref:Uncharacterized protein n=1 Tax=Asparagus officinalis TaxID=4686 RepID=A0A5P1ED77_ASPOF|nr:uncharacterized protein A4U43_C07F19530 [Asparagus officinalis]
MVKFSRQLEAQLIPEWKDAFVNYRQLKKQVKKIKLSFLRPSPPPSDGSERVGFSVLDPIYGLFGRYNRSNSNEEDEENLYEMDLVRSREAEVKDFFEKLDEELEKVDNFYTSKETEFSERAEILSKQLQILLDLKKILDEHRRRRRQHKPLVDSSRGSGNDLFATLSNSSSFSENACDDMPTDGSSSPITDEIIAALERNGVSFVGSARSKAKKGLKPKTTTMRIDIPATNATKTISAVTSMIWEDIVNGQQRKEGSPGGGGDNINRKKIQCAEKMIRSAFLELYKGLNLLRTYRFVLEESEEITLHQLRQGLFTGSFAALFSVYAILAHLSGIFSTSTQVGYMETVYPVFSMFALLSLHIFLYGCNLFMWKDTRINHNFIFEFSPTTALKHRDAFLICTSFMTTVVGALVIQLVLKSSGFSRDHVDALPGILLLLFIAILICPFNVLYRSTRYCFLRVMRNIIFSPFYKVLMVDFFMADQLTSQIPLLRHMEFTSCYFVASLLKSDPYETCTRSHQYKLLAYVISFLPYYCRAMQCIRRYIEEGYDINHLANCGKYVSAMLAAAVRWKYAVNPSMFWLVMVIMTSTMATFYQLYWDFVKDWGLFDLNSKNRWLRDELILKNKNVYYVSIVFNFVLRLGWIETISRLSLGPVEYRLVDFLLASLEIIRRGHWNFYRLENEHLNNVGKFRAVKTVPLPFRDMESDA